MPMKSTFPADTLVEVTNFFSGGDRARAEMVDPETACACAKTCNSQCATCFPLLGIDTATDYNKTLATNQSQATGSS